MEAAEVDRVYGVLVTMGAIRRMDYLKYLSER